MKIKNEHIETLKRDGFVAIENFLTREETRDALAGIHQFYGPNYDDRIRAGRKNPIQNPQELFPWDHSGLNHAMTHPDLIDAAERMARTTNLILSEAHLGLKYAGDEAGECWHMDYRNNTLGPEITDPVRMMRHFVFFHYFTDVTLKHAPICMLKHGDPREKAVKVTGPAGTMCIYTTYTWHTATAFKNPTGYRAVAWSVMSDARYPFDFPRTFTYKSGASYEGMARFIREASPRQLQLLGFPAPGDPFWTNDYIEGMEKRYPGFCGDLYRTRSAGQKTRSETQSPFGRATPSL